MESSHSPFNLERLSVVLATTMLAFSLTRFIPTTDFPFSFNFFSIVFELKFNIGSLLSFVTALMAAVGSHWIVPVQPNEPGKRNGLRTYQHIIIPLFFALVISITLNQSLENQYWWVVFGLGSLFFGLILWAEYLVKTSIGPRYSLASVGLIALSFALLMILNVALRTNATRLFLELPILAMSIWMVTTRMISLRLNGKFLPRWSLIIVLFFVQIAAALHYMDVSPLQYGLLITGGLYAGISLVCGLAEERKRVGLYLEPVSMLATIIILFLLV